MGLISNLFVKLKLDNKQFEKGIDQSQKKVGGFSSKLKGLGTAIGGFFAFTAIIAGIRSAINTNIKFEKSLSTLKSLTGVTAEEMKFYAAEAKRMGETTTQSASQVAKAFTLIGSKKPELLANKEALAQVTEQAIILAEAANIDVATAANALANSLNQMGEGAQKSGEFINALAAGSKFGAADINFLNAAIEKAGGTASAVGLKFEELVAGIETIAPKIAEPTTAGLQFRQVLVRLAGGVDKFNPSVVGLSKALHNLQGEQLSINELTAKFGIININAAKALIDGADAYDDYKKKVTGTNTALEQQKVNIDNVQGSITQLSSAWEGFVLNMQKGNGAANAFLKSLTGILFVINGTSFEKTAFQGLSDAIEAEVVRGGDVLELFKASAKSVVDEINALELEKLRLETDFPNARGIPIAIEEIAKKRALLTEINEKLQKLETDNLKKSLAERFDLEKKGVEELENLRKSFSSMTGERKKEADLILPLIEREIDKRLKASQDEIESYKSIDKAIEDLKTQKESLSKTDLESISIINDKIKALEAEKKALDALSGAVIDRTATATGITPKSITDVTVSKDEKLTTAGTLGEDIIEAQKEKQERLLANQRSFNEQAAALAADFVADTVTVFAEGIGDMLSGDANLADFGKALLNAVGGFLSNLGKMMIQFGATALVYSILAKALSNPVTAGPAALGMIAAGAALVAIGGAISGAAGNGGGGGGAITTIDTRGSGTGGSSGGRTPINQSQPQNVQVEVVGTISNKTIALSNAQGTKDLRR